MQHQYAAYRGQIMGLVANNTQAVFITRHKEQQPTALYRLDTSSERVSLAVEPLPCGATALVAADDKMWFAGTDGKLYQSPFALGKSKSKSKALKIELGTDPVIGLALLAAQHLAVLQNNRLIIVDCAKQTVVQTLTDLITTTCIANNPDGSWLAVGHENGQVSIYQYEDSDTQWHLLSTDKIHQGAVSALCFEAHELRFYSAGHDKKLYSTHAQNTSQPLDKGRSRNHEAIINTIILGEERFFTGAEDKSIKGWAYGGGQPLTFKQDLTAVQSLARITYRDKPCLIAVGADASLRLVEMGPEERFGELRLVVQDAYALAISAVASDDPNERKQALDELAAYDDKQALRLLQKQFKQETDKLLCEHIVQLVRQSSHADVHTLLEGFLTDKRFPGVRELSFNALLERLAADDFAPHEKALATTYLDIGRLAQQDLAKRAETSLLAQQALIKTLQHSLAPLRLQALALLEEHYPSDSPQASLLALQDISKGGSSKDKQTNDIRKAALIRLFQRGLLSDAVVQQAILLAQDAPAADLRYTAFLVAVSSRPALAKALKERDADLARHLQELDDFNLSGGSEDSEKIELKGRKAAKKATKATPKKPPKLSHEDTAVLLQTLSNRHADLSFLAAYALALLQDQRAFGLLLVLSQDKEPSIRAGVCRAFAALQQAEGIAPLGVLINDSEASVRDAAFSALQTLHNDPLLTAEQGLRAQQQDSHARALKLLLDNLPKSGTGQALDLLKAALNDPFEAIRQETFKACQNRQLGGSEQETLQLLLSSRYENVHQEVVRELMAKSQVVPILSWVKPALLDLLNNPFKAVRRTVFDYLITQKKRFDPLAALDSAVNSRYTDVRQLAFEFMQKKPNTAYQPYLEVLLGDDNQVLRTGALAVLINAEQLAPINEALASPYEDIQVAAVNALARWGDPRAYDTLHRLLTREVPHKAQELAEWDATTAQAIAGLAALGDVRGFEQVKNFIHYEDSVLIAEQAAKALPWVVDISHIEELLALQSDERAIVQAHASFALALLGDARARQAFDRKLISKHLSVALQLAAELGLGDVTPMSLQSYLDRGSPVSVILILAAHELLLHSAEPKLSLLGLSLPNPHLQKFCADLMACYSDPDARWQHLRNWLIRSQRRHDEDKWTIEVADIQQIAAVLVHGSGSVRAHLLTVLAELEQPVPLKTWQWHYTAFAKRYAAAIAAAGERSTVPEPPKPLQHEWNQYALGAYLGLIRQVSGSRGGNTELALGMAALRSLCRLAEQDTELRLSVVSSLLTLLNVRQVEICQLAFTSLPALGLALSELAQAAIRSPQKDIARQGLQLLIEHTSTEQAHAELQVLLQGDQFLLAEEAYILLVEQSGLLATAPYALQTKHVAIRQHCVAELAAQADSADIQAVLLQACTNDDFTTAHTAANALAKRQHPAVFEALQALLDQNNDAAQQLALLQTLRQLQTPQVAVYTLDYLANNPLNRQSPEHLYRLLAGYRQATVFSPLLARLESHPKESKWIINTALAITGYDQPIVDYQERSQDRSWLEKQHPRRDDLLIELFAILLKNNAHKQAAELARSLGWAADQAMDQALINAIPVIHSLHLKPVVEALVYRLEKRQGHPEGLIQLLGHKDAEIQFIAAEGLAKNGHGQGYPLLFSAIDYNTNADYRQRAVLALGHLADERAMDKLLSLTSDPEHFLHEVAIEAIGHMRESEHNERILKLLQASLQQADPYSDKKIHVLNGLRWFNTLEAWQAISAFIQNDEELVHQREHAVSLLRYWDSEASRYLVLQLLQYEHNNALLNKAYQAAKYLWSVPESVAPYDYALVQGYGLHLDDKVLDRIATHAPTAQLLKLLGAEYPHEHSKSVIMARLNQSLLQRDDHQAQQLQTALQSNVPLVVATIARLLTRQPKLSKALQADLQTVVSKHYSHWQACWQSEVSSQSGKAKRLAGKRLQEAQDVFCQLLWCATVHVPNCPELEMVLTHSAASHNVLQLSILQALLAQQPSKSKSLQKLLASVKPLLDASLPELRALAHQVLAQYDDISAVNWQYLLAQPDLLKDKPLTTAIQTAVSDGAHYSQALPVLIQQQDVACLNAVIEDTTLLEHIRLGAIEALALIPTEAAEQTLQQLQKTFAESEEQALAQAIYKALRRQQRGQQKIALAGATQ